MLVAASQIPVKSCRFVIAHVNHKLRGVQSDRDAKFVAGLARRYSFPFGMKVRSISKSRSGNLEERAREQRYEALIELAHQYKSDLVLTAHTEDDQVETIFMNLLRGTGVDGIGGMSAIRFLEPNIRLGRPFLSISRQELHRWLDSSNTRSRIDKTNKDESLLRNWLRRRIFPQLEERSPGFKTRVAKLAAVLQDEKDFWADFLTVTQKRICLPSRGGQLLDLKGLLSYSAAVQRRFLRRIVGENLLTFDAVERLRRWMMSPPTGGRTLQLRQGWTVTRLSKSQGAPSANLFLIKDENHK